MAFDQNRFAITDWARRRYLTMSLDDRAPCILSLAVVWLFLCASSTCGQESPADHVPADSGLPAANGAPQVDEAPEADEATAAETADASARARLIRVSLPITGNQDNHIKRMIEQLLGDWPETEGRPTLVFEFWPPPAAEQGRGSEFERCLSLARYLASGRLSRVRTVAYLPRSVFGHAVLPVLACEEIIVHPEASLGQAGIDEPDIEPTIRQGYLEISDRRRTVPAALALAMLDSRVKVYQATTAAGTQYVLEEDLAALQEETNVQTLDTLVAAGDWGVFTGNQLRLDLGVASRLVTDRRNLAEALQLSSDQLDLDPSLDRKWKPIRVDLIGPINASATHRVQNMIADEIRSGDVNLICLWIDSGGGSPTDSGQLATYLSQLDGSLTRTVAFINKKARADAAVVAMACDHLVVQNEAILGGPGEHTFSTEEIADMTQVIRAVMAEKSRHWSPVVAMIDPDIQLFRWRLEESSLVEIISPEEVAELRDPKQWRQGREISGKGKIFKLDGLEAEELGLARLTVANYKEFKQAYHLENDPKLVEPNWAHDLIEAIASPHVAASLLFLAFMAIVGEVSSPGVGLGGFVSAVCLMLYFWSQFLHGTADMLEILLFLMGMACLAAEVFLLPGFGVFGVGGFALLMISLVLASQTFVFPSNEYQWKQLPWSMLMVTAPLCGLLSGLWIVGRYMDRAPLLRRLVLAPPESGPMSEQAQREALVNFSGLLGAAGIATTPISPSGKARFGDQLVDVTSDGEVIGVDAPVRVMEVHGNRVLVTQVEQESE